MKLIAGLTLLLCLSSRSIKAQIFQTRAEIIKEKGYGYTAGVTDDDGTKYIYYDDELNTNASGKYTRRKVMYFMNLDNGSEICYMWKIIEPSSETNSNVAYFKSNFVEVAYMQWKDYEYNIIYDMVVKDGLCIISAWCDLEK